MNKIDNSLTRLKVKKGEETQISKISNERENITTNLTEIKSYYIGKQNICI